MTPCEHEARVVRAMRDGRLTPELEAHVSACAACREIADVVGAMAGLAGETMRLAERRRLPEASQLWWKGQLARRWEAEARAVAPLDRMQRVEVAAGLIAAVVLLGSFVSTLGSSAGAARQELLPALTSLVSTSALAWGGLVVLGAVTASLVMVRRLLADS
jgi:predicted anti-sigma-YlaC factor YlaD